MGRYDERRILVFSMVSAGLASAKAHWLILDFLQLENNAYYSEGGI